MMVGNKFYQDCIRRVAIHESGHATFFGAIGYSIKKVNVTCLSGCVRLSKYPPTFHMLVGYLTGLAAETIILGRKHAKDYGSSDISNARSIAFKIGRRNWDDVFVAGKVAAERFARANREQIEAVAEMM